jgi:mRNA interferase HigB
MQVVAKRTLIQFWRRHPDAEMPLGMWWAIADKAEWTSPQDIRDVFGTADFVGDNRVVFDIGGNKYRLIVHVAYKHKSVLIKFIGTHAEYDRINAETV